MRLQYTSKLIKTNILRRKPLSKSAFLSTSYQPPLGQAREIHRVSYLNVKGQGQKDFICNCRFVKGILEFS